MKLLSRFIWLIIGISALVFAGVAIFQIRAVNEFELIKKSIGEEYDVQVDKMLAPDLYGKGMASYLNDVRKDPSTSLFVSTPTPDEFYISIILNDEMLKYNDVDAVWFFNEQGENYYFKTVSNIIESDFPIESSSINEVLNKDDLFVFYAENKIGVTCFHSQAITDSNLKKIGYAVMASVIDERWINEYMLTINNSTISVVSANEILPEIENKTIRITRELIGYDNNNVAVLNIELHLPFLSLWNKTNSTDKWLMTGSIVIIVFFLIVFLIIWVISPLRKISFSLQKGDSVAIQPLIKGSTEMGDVARMISDYHQKNDELEASESIKRHIIEQAQVGIIIAEANSNLIITTNPYACQLIKTNVEAVINNVTGNFLEQPENNLESSEGFESFLFNSKGEKIPILRTTTSMIMEGRKVTMDTFVDLSEIRSLQDKLEEEKKKLSLAVQNSGLVFCEYDFKTNKITIDDAWAFLTKGESKNIGVNILNNIYESDKKKIQDNFEALKTGAKDTLVAEFRVTHPQRGLIWINVSVLITKRDEDYLPKVIIGLFEDITERILVQQELIKAKEKAEESDRLKSSYLGNMSHKIRTPLNTIVGFANLLSEEELEADQKENFINIIRNDTEQVLHLIDDMINIAKIDAQQLDVDTKACHLNKIMENLAEYYKANEKTNRIKFTVKTMLDNNKDIVQTDEDKLSQALSNVLNNAFKFTNDGNIELGYFVNPVDNKVIIYVKDTGIGIAEEHKDKIFNRFYQVNPMTEGTGLGLTISASLAKLLKAKLYFDSKPNEGSTFYFELAL